MGLLRASVSVPESAGATYSVVVVAGEVDATNSDFAFPATPSDPKLSGPAAAPSPAPH